MSNSSLALAEDSLKELNIPPQPEILTYIQSELNKENPNINLVSDKIAEDVALFSSILKLINSPYFGMRSEIKSIPHAISLIGIENLMINIAVVKLRNQMKQPGSVHMPRYWDNSMDVAKLSSYLAKELDIASPAEAYALGLFKDAGIPLPAQRYENYKGILKQQNETELTNYTDVEDEYFNTNHCIVSYLITRQWGMNKALRKACLYHHDVQYITDENYNDDQHVRQLILIAKISDYVANSKRKESNFERPKIESFALYFLGLSEPDFIELSHNLIDILDGTAGI